MLVLNRLDDRALEQMLARAEAVLGRSLPLDADARAALRAIADGDGRYLLNLVEVLAELPAEPQLDAAALAAIVQRRMPLYDKAQEGHYNLISALHKSLRGSDTDAALYWFARMIEGGEDPRYIARRLLRFAVEDVGLAEPQALVQALAAWEAYERLGSPEGELALVQCVIFLGSGAEVERGVQGAGRGDAAGAGDRLADAAQAYPECADAADAGSRATVEATSTTMMRRRPFPDRTTFPTGSSASRLYHPERARLRAGDRRTAGLLGQAARSQGAGMSTNRTGRR